MNRGFYLQTSRVEDSHWWFRHRRRLVARFLDPLLGTERAARRGLDLGCGSGGSLELLDRYCAEVTGIDRSGYALELARAKHPDAVLVQGDANDLAALVAEGSQDLVAVFNLLYHRWVENDQAVLDQIRGRLRPGGLLVLTEPAFPALFRRHDALDYGARRYRRTELEGKVSASGLTLLRSSYFNAAAFLPAALLARLQRGSAGKEAGAGEDERLRELSLPPSWINRALYAVMGAERFWLTRLGRLPFGVGVLILARRPA
jgi:SAM-dependent methyltransferase